MIEEELPGIDSNKIVDLEITKSYLGKPNIIIEDKDEIQSILNNLFNSDQRIYNGGRIDMDGSEFESEFELSINFYDSNYRYFIGDDYILSDQVELYKVLGENNQIYNYLNSLYEEN